MNVLVLQGPNLNLLGEREPEIYGTLTLAQLHRQLRVRGRTLGMVLRAKQSNHEGQLIDWIHEHRKWMHGLIINPGALTHYAWALRDAVALLDVPVFEVHLSNVMRREPFRRISVLKDVRTGHFHGKGLESYLEALEALARVK